jgi:hypothetical protein
LGLGLADGYGIADPSRPAWDIADSHGTEEIRDPEGRADVDREEIRVHNPATAEDNGAESLNLLTGSLARHHGQLHSLLPALPRHPPPL